VVVAVPSQQRGIAKDLGEGDGAGVRGGCVVDGPNDQQPVRLGATGGSRTDRCGCQVLQANRLNTVWAPKSGKSCAVARAWVRICLSVGPRSESLQLIT